MTKKKTTPSEPRLSATKHTAPPVIYDDTPRVVMVSLWRNDTDKHLERRIEHLLAKTYSHLRYVWVVGDSADDTEAVLQQAAADAPEKDIVIVHFDSHIPGDAPAPRLRRQSMTISAGFDMVDASDDYWLIHESDLISPPDVVELFLATGKCPVAGWITLGNLFYDTFGYHARGHHFQNHPPYHSVYKPDEPFEVEGVGSCFLFHAEDLRKGLRCYTRGVEEICAKLKANGRSIWVDPRIRVVQPEELWESRAQP